MTDLELIDYMIDTLKVVQTAIEYKNEYYTQEKNDPDFYCYGHMGRTSQAPNKALIKDCLSNVGRIAFGLKNQIK